MSSDKIGGPLNWCKPTGGFIKSFQLGACSELVWSLFDCRYMEKTGWVFGCYGWLGIFLAGSDDGGDFCPFYICGQQVRYVEENCSPISGEASLIWLSGTASLYVNWIVPSKCAWPQAGDTALTLVPVGLSVRQGRWSMCSKILTIFYSRQRLLQPWGNRERKGCLSLARKGLRQVRERSEVTVDWSLKVFSR